jgi:hypothetical protein
LSITGAVTNDGSIDFSDDYDKVAGAVGGTGNFGLSNGASLDFASSVASGETVTFSTNSAPDLLTLNSGSSFSGAIEDFFTAGDGVDLTNFAYAHTTFKYTQTGTDSASWTLTDGSNSAVINFAGEAYTKSDFPIGAANGTKARSSSSSEHSRSEGRRPVCTRPRHSRGRRLTNFSIAPEKTESAPGHAMGRDASPPAGP